MNRRVQTTANVSRRSAVGKRVLQECGSAVLALGAIGGAVQCSRPATEVLNWDHRVVSVGEVAHDEYLLPDFLGHACMVVVGLDYVELMPLHPGHLIFDAAHADPQYVEDVTRFQVIIKNGRVDHPERREFADQCGQATGTLPSVVRVAVAPYLKNP
jgi:hypothetical protein